ncbi:MAG: acyl carrier protein [Firmicutes bacterium HGW-Firmicutes-1]|jgi:acyl carrier protein|nr:MAG: acyl carrier protein [Firmicutes bacterium HGW-Firmicutes-1]
MDNSKLLEIIAKYANYDSGKISEDMSFADDLGVDSLDLVDIISALEDEFKIEITDEDLAKGIETVGNAVELLKSKIEEIED